MRLPFLASLLSSGLACLTLAGQSQEAPPAPPTQEGLKTYSPALRPTVGDLARYKLVMTMTTSMKNEKGENPLPGGNMDTKINGVVRYRTVEVKPNGNIVQRMGTEKMQTQMMGNELPVPQTPPVTAELNRRGLTVGSGRIPAGAQTQAMGMMGMMGGGGANLPGTSIVFPDKPVRIGDTWEVKSTLPVMNMTLNYRVTLVGVETYKGREVLRMKQIVTSPLSMPAGPGGDSGDADVPFTIKGNFEIESTSLVVEKTGLVLQSAGDLKMKMNIVTKDAASSPIGNNMNVDVVGKIGMDLIEAVPTGAQKPTPKPAAKAKRVPAKR